MLTNKTERRRPGWLDQVSPWMTHAEAADYLRVTTRCIRLMIADGRLTGYTMGGRRTTRVRRDQVANLMQPVASA